MVQVRPAQAQDYDQVLALLMEVHAHHVAAVPGVFQPSSPVLLPPAVFAERLADPDRLILVLEEAGEVLAFAYLVHARRPENPVFIEPEYLSIDQFGVRGDCRRRGYGRQLVEAVVVEATRRGLARIELSVWAANAEAVAFYERLGFQTYVHRMERRLDR